MGRSLTNYSRFSIIFMTIFVGVMGGLIFAGIAANESMRSSITGSGSTLALVLIVIPLPILIVIAYSFVTRRQRTRYESARLMIAEGRTKVTRKVSGGRYGPRAYFELKVGKFRLNLLEEYAALFVNGEVYRVYYIQVGKAPTVLSIDENT